MNLKSARRSVCQSPWWYRLPPLRMVQARYTCSIRNSLAKSCGKVIFESFLLARPSAKITDLGGAKKVRRSGLPPRCKNGASIVNFQAKVPKKAISFQFLTFWTPRNPGPPRKTCRKTVLFKDTFVCVFDALSAKVVFETFLWARPSAKIAEPAEAKRVRRSGPEAPKM